MNAASRSFAVVLSEAGRDAKVRQQGMSAIEQANEAAYRRFRKAVTSHLCAFFEDVKEVKLAVFETMPQLIIGRTLVGWVCRRPSVTSVSIPRWTPSRRGSQRTISGSQRSMTVKASSTSCHTENGFGSFVGTNWSWKISSSCGLRLRRRRDIQIFVPVEWARKWPAEHIWKLRKTV